jgi:hypothetical protein
MMATVNEEFRRHNSMVADCKILLQVGAMMYSRKTSSELSKGLLSVGEDSSRHLDGLPLGAWAGAERNEQPLSSR